MLRTYGIKVTTPNRKKLKITRFEFGPLLKIRGSLEFVNGRLLKSVAPNIP